MYTCTYTCTSPYQRPLYPIYVSMTYLPPHSTRTSNINNVESTYLTAAGCLAHKEIEHLRKTTEIQPLFASLSMTLRAPQPYPAHTMHFSHCTKIHPPCHGHLALVAHQITSRQISKESQAIDYHQPKSMHTPDPTLFNRALTSNSVVHAKLLPCNDETGCPTKVQSPDPSV